MNSSFPLKPQGWTTINDVLDNENTKTNILSSFDFVLSSFGPTSGFCPRCNSPVLQKGQQLSKVKLIHTMRVPHFVQSLLLKCSSLSCNFGLTSYQKDYVDTLPSVFKSQLNAIVDRRCNGIDIDVIRLEQMSNSAKSIEDATRANLYAKYKHWELLYKASKKSALKISHDDYPYPLFPDEFVVKGLQLNRAFMHDYLSECVWLLHEQAVATSDFNSTMESHWKKLLLMKQPSEKVTQWYERVAPLHHKFLLQKSSGEEEKCLDTNFSLVEKRSKRCLRCFTHQCLPYK